MPIDLDNLSDEVLFYSHDRFFQFIEEYLGSDEMKLFKLQSIKSSKTLINVPDVLGILSFKYKEIIELKHRLCFIDDNNPENFVVKSGVKTSINDLIRALKEKNIKHLKRIKHLNSLSTSSLSSTNADNLPTDMSWSNTSNYNSNDSQSTSVISTAPQSTSSDTYIQSISDRIEKFSLNTFQNLTLMNDIDYTICLQRSGSDINGHIKCGCNTTIKIGDRSKSNSFQLSAYLKHLKSSHCRMVKKKKQGLDKADRITDKSLDETLQGKDYLNVDGADDYDEQNLIYPYAGSQITTDISSVNNSNSDQRKRSLPTPTTSINNNKMKSK